MPGRGLRTRAWAEEVDEEESSSPIFDDTTGQYRGSDNLWHEGIEVERGMSRHRLDTQHGFYRSIVRNQQDREEYEQSWQDAYKEAGPFQQRWGVGVKVQQNRRAEESRPQSVWSAQHEAQSTITDNLRSGREDAGSHANAVIRSDTQGVSSTVQQMERPVQIRPPMTHEELEASLYNTHLSPGPQSHQQPQHHPTQMRVPSIGYDGVALGVPVYMQQLPAPGPPIRSKPTAAAAHQAAAAAPAGWAYDSAISGWGGQSLSAPQIALSPQPDASAGLWPQEQSEAAKEKVRLGFQVYRPPPQLGQPSSLELEKKGKGDLDAASHTRREMDAPSVSQPARDTGNRETSVRQSRLHKQQPTPAAPHSSDARQNPDAGNSSKAASSKDTKQPKSDQHAPQREHGESRQVQLDRVQPRAVPVHADGGRAARLALAAEQKTPDHGSTGARRAPGGKNREQGQKQKQGSEPAAAHREAVSASGGPDAKQGGSSRRARVAHALPASLPEAPPGFDAGSASRQAEERRRLGIAFIRSLLSPNAAAAAAHPDKAPSTKAPQPKGRPPAESTASPALSPPVGKPSRRDRKERHAEANGVSSSQDREQAGSSQRRASANAGKQPDRAARLPSNAAQTESLPSKQKKEKTQERRRSSSAQQVSKEGSSLEATGRPPGLDPAKAAGSAAADSKVAGKESGSPRALKHAVAPAYFESRAKPQQSQD